MPETKLEHMCSRAYSSAPYLCLENPPNKLQTMCYRMWDKIFYGTLGHAIIDRLLKMIVETFPKSCSSSSRGKSWSVRGRVGAYGEEWDDRSWRFGEKGMHVCSSEQRRLDSDKGASKTWERERPVVVG